MNMNSVAHMPAWREKGSHVHFAESHPAKKANKQAINCCHFPCILLIISKIPPPKPKQEGTI